MAPERLPPGHRHELPDSRRADPSRLQREIRTISESPIVTAFLDAVDATLLVLNAERQIVAHNGRLLPGGPSPVTSLRPGEALECAHARSGGGCGVTPACQICGALGAILACERRGRAAEANCVVASELVPGRALEFSVRATPVLVDGSRFTVVSLRDISSEKRKEALEQVFFHDVLNTIAGLAGWAEHLRHQGADRDRCAERIELLSRRLEREIRDHRSFKLAEDGTLVPSISRFRAAELLADLQAVFSSHTAARERRLSVEAPPPELELESDQALLRRVLVNMVCNALEATPPGGLVRVVCERCAGGSGLPRHAGTDLGAVQFRVHNEGVMPPEVQERIFQRSFSTKAARGRGLGTYGMKLLGERYLGGRVAFRSTSEGGTVFSIALPVRPGS